MKFYLYYLSTGPMWVMISLDGQPPLICYVGKPVEDKRLAIQMFENAFNSLDAFRREATKTL